MMENDPCRDHLRVLGLLQRVRGDDFRGCST